MLGFAKGGYKLWAGKQTGKPVLLVISALSFTLSFYIGYRQLYQPWMRKKKLTEAEGYAKIIYEHEMTRH